MADSKTTDFDAKCINTVRCLAADVVQNANSGHPGAPMGMAPMAHTLFRKIMKFNPKNPSWVNRDRFVLSNGHACTLQYIMLHLLGYNLSMDDLKAFRQVNSLTPGHPETNHTPGIEVTTGPLGQGVANAVGMALAEAHLAATFNKPNFKLIDNYTYVFCGDGCHMEGVSGEAASLAGHLQLGKLIVLYDDNQISIDGPTSLAFTEDVPKRFEAYGWHTLTVNGGDSDVDAIEKAILVAKSVTDKPSLISVKTTIGFGSVNEGKEKTHGSPLGDEDIANVKKKFGLNPDEKFAVPDDVRAEYGKAVQRGADAEAEWNKLFDAYAKEHPDLAADLKRRLNGERPQGWQDKLPRYKPEDKASATRSLSGEVLNAVADLLPEVIGGSADLTPSNKTQLKKSGDFQAATPEGRYIRFGVREHGMAAVANGIVAYGGLLPYTATFLNFIEYNFPAIRLTALSKHQQLFIMTHDSIGLGEDGPTHQPIEALALTRATPNLLTFRPADGNEVTGSYIQAISHSSMPSVLALTRQNLPHLKGSSPEAVAKGGYVVSDAKDAELIIVATGSEVSLALETAAKLPQATRVVSMPCTELFDQQPAEYRRSVLTPGVPVVSVEVLSVTGWERYAHHSIGMRTFGMSGPAKDVFDHFGFTPEKLAANITNFLENYKKSFPNAAFGILQAHH